MYGMVSGPWPKKKNNKWIKTKKQSQRRTIRFVCHPKISLTQKIYLYSRHMLKAYLSDHIWCPCADPLIVYSALGAPVDRFGETRPIGSAGAKVSVIETRT